MAKNAYDDDWAYLWLSGVWSLGQQLVSQRSSRSGSREQVVICRSGVAKGDKVWVYSLGGFQMQICTRQARLLNFSFVLASWCDKLELVECLSTNMASILTQILDKEIFLYNLHRCLHS